ncbi:MAG: hypothetical protein ABJO67_21480, partial [Pseudoruegeria sp.]
CCVTVFFFVGAVCGVHDVTCNFELDLRASACAFLSVIHAVSRTDSGASAARAGLFTSSNAAAIFFGWCGVFSMASSIG